jgi:hypothetical protein
MANGLKGRRTAADGGFYIKQEHFGFYKGVSEWTEAKFASHCTHHPKDKCHKYDLCHYQRNARRRSSGDGSAGVSAHGRERRCCLVAR